MANTKKLYEEISTYSDEQLDKMIEDWAVQAAKYQRLLATAKRVKKHRARANKEELAIEKPDTEPVGYQSARIAEANRSLSMLETLQKPLTVLELASIGYTHFGNPIPQEWYKAARELEEHHGIKELAIEVANPLGR